VGLVLICLVGVMDPGCSAYHFMFPNHPSFVFVAFVKH
jgi:hypothetical protein